MHIFKRAAGTKGRKLCLLLLLILFLCAAFDHRLTVRNYTIDAPQLSDPVRIALITDLHSCYYGEQQKGLIEALHRQAPDLVLLVGDIFDDELPNKNSEAFIKGISGRYPCYYVTGNHEYWSGPENVEVLLTFLKENGVFILSGDCETIYIGAQALNLCGVDDPAAFTALSPASDVVPADPMTDFTKQLDAVSEASDNGFYTLLLSHRPEYIDLYASRGFDLVLSGHAHGGQWRIPGILNGLFAPNQGLFPDYTGGFYELDGTAMIVSRGLARESTPVPRIFNRPELVIIDLT
ncbi:MAG: metallophosphoesterase [Clostridia bacterium]|nr:metallophosphoesterase [Clostridia bacterium]